MTTTATTAAAAEKAVSEVRSALGEEDPITAMRKLAIDLAGRGLSQGAIEGAFGLVARELYETGRDEEAGWVTEVLDMMAEWYANGKPID
jgi:hypothetical protein